MVEVTLSGTETKNLTRAISPFATFWHSGNERSSEKAARPIEIIARMDTDKGLRRGGFALGLSIGGENRFGAIASAPGDVSQIDGVSVYGLVARVPAPRRR